MWVKLCGVRDPASAKQLAALGPDAVGLNFHPPSPRFVGNDVAREITAVLPAEIERVGVFVDRPARDIAATVSRVGLTGVQLHGDEPPETLAELRERLPDVRLIRAWRTAADGLQDLAVHLDAAGVLPDAVLIDARVPGAYGGTGVTVDWERLATTYEPDWPPLILAGGLTPANVAGAVGVVRPWGVDTAGGVESSPGVKDAALAAAFVTAARGPRPGRRR